MKRPNVIFVFADQWRYHAAGYTGDPNVRTPNIDKLAAESISFSNAISGCPICSPYRASLMTGQYPLKTGIFMNDLCLSDDAVTIAQAYAKAGYDTGYIGKWHLDGHGRSSYIPGERRHGFGYWKTLECTHDYNDSPYYEGDSQKLRKWNGYDVFAQTIDAVEYLKCRKGKDAPFLLMVSYGTPHDPYHTAPADYLKMYPEEEIIFQPNVREECKKEAGRYLQGYYAHISALDNSVGRICSAIGEMDMAKDTIFVLTSDHGDSVMSHCEPHTGNINKQRPYDESVRVPFLLRYPAVLGEYAGVMPIPFSTVDIMPTLLDLSGLEIPDTVDGISFAPALCKNAEIERKGVLLACYSPFSDWCRDRGGREYRGVRTERYTYVRTLQGPWLLFDNENDPYQINNLINKMDYMSVQNKLEKMLQKLLREQDDDFKSGEDLCRKYGYHNLTDADDIPCTKGDEWYIEAQRIRKLRME